MNIDISTLATPSYIVDERLLIKNLEVLKSVSDRTGCHILLAQKGFSMFKTYPLIGQYLNGTTASTLFEAKLGKEEMGKETHIFNPAYKEEEFDEIMDCCDHIVFNSFHQWNKYKDKVKNKVNGQVNIQTDDQSNNQNNVQSNDQTDDQSNNQANVQSTDSPNAVAKTISCGIRINPEYSEIETDIYNPCFTGSRLGVTLSNFKEDELDGIEGLHFHTMCEQNSDVLKRTIEVLDEEFGKYMGRMKWINFGGGHHITRPDYDIETLIECILFIKNKYDVEVYLEPGEAVALNTGYLVAKVLDIVENEIENAILDTSAACHMPDVLEMPYRPEIIGAGEANEYAYTYRLGGPTCLAGDIIGDYSFKEPLKPGDKLIFCDMAHYTMVKNNTFNGVNLPSIALYREETGIEMVKEFTYEDFKNRLS